MRKIVKVTTAGVVSLVSATILAGYVGAKLQPVNAVAITNGQLHSASAINGYITSRRIQPVGITRELHSFEMFHYSTNGQKPVGVVFHYTDNASNYSARNEANYEINGGWNNAFVHSFIDAKTILNIHDTNYGCWGSGPNGNKQFVQFELVTARNRDEFAHSISNAAWYVAYLAHEYGWSLSLASQHNGSGTLWTHYDVTHYLGGTDHTDPIAYLNKWGYSTSQFLDLAKAYYNDGEFLDNITSSRGMDYNAVVSQNGRNDGLYASGPYYTSESTRIPATLSAHTLNGQNVKVIHEDVTNRGTWAQIRTSNGQTWWMDKKGLSVVYDKVLSTNSDNYGAYLHQNTRNDGLYKDGPYMTGATTFEVAEKSAKSYNLQAVTVLGQETTSRGTWVKVRLRDGSTWWLDKAGLGYLDSISNVQNVKNVPVRITQTGRDDGIYATGPYLTSSSTIAPATKTLKEYDGQAATVLKQEDTPKATWVQIKLKDGSTWWVDKRGVAYFDSILSSNDDTRSVIVRQTGRNDGLYQTGPYMTDVYTVIPASKTAQKYDGQRATVIGEKVTNRATWVHIKMNDGSTWWMDSKGVEDFSFDKILSTNNVSYNAQISQAGRDDGLYKDGPYMTGSTTYTPAWKTAKSLNGQSVVVLKEENTSRGTWVQVKLADGSTWWMDKKGIVAFDTISNRVEVAYKAKVNQNNRNDGLYQTGPFYTSNETRIPAEKTAKNYNGQIVTVIAQATTSKANWVQVKFNDGSTWWMDKAGVVDQ